MQTLTELHRSWRLGSWLPYACYLLCKILIVFFCSEKDHFYHSSISWNGPYWTHNAESDTRITCAVDPVKSGRRPLTRHPGADEPRTFCRPKRRPGTSLVGGFHPSVYFALFFCCDTNKRVIYVWIIAKTNLWYPAGCNSTPFFSTQGTTGTHKRNFTTGSWTLASLQTLLTYY